MTLCDLTQRDCAPCQGAAAMLPDPAAMMLGLHPDWQLDGSRLLRRFAFKGFAKAVQMANLAAWLGEKMGHHLDVGFGRGCLHQPRTGWLNRE